MRTFLYFLMLMIVLSCGKTTTIEKEIAKIEIEVIIERFDKAFARSRPDDLSELKSKYPYLFPQQFPDSLWIKKLKDTLQQELSDQVIQQFPDFEDEKTALLSLFQHTKYYFPDFKPPKIITLTSEVDYNNRLIYADTLLLIALDSYLGASHYFYKGIPDYLKKNFNRSQIPVNAATQIIQNNLSYPQSRDFLAQMIYYGKILYIKDKLLPLKTDAEKIGYTTEEWRWAIDNEVEIWRYFVTQNLLFSTDLELRERFIQPAPFSKFYLGIDAESPGQLGQYIGWKIVRAYMKNNAVSLQQLLNAPAAQIFNQSRFKPQK